MTEVWVGQSLIVSNSASTLYNSEITPARTLSISGLKSRVLKLPFFNLKMMMKNGLDFFFFFNWNFTACLDCNIQVLNIQKINIVQLDFTNLLFRTHHL